MKDSVKKEEKISIAQESGKQANSPSDFEGPQPEITSPARLSCRKVDKSKYISDANGTLTGADLYLCANNFSFSRPALI